MSVNQAALTSQTNDQQIPSMVNICIIPVDRKADVTGFGTNELSGLTIVTCTGLRIKAVSGTIIDIFNQYADYNEKKTIHSISQIRNFRI
jgi:hypothetical protein